MQAEVSFQRLFFALWPPADVAARMMDVAGMLEVTGRPVTRESLHVTLAFHGRCDTAARDGLVALANDVHMAPFNLVFDRLGGFRGSRIVGLGMSNPPESLHGLADALRGLDDRRQDFIPHVTLYRSAMPPEVRPIAPIPWRVRDFVLLESGVNGVAGAYRTLARWKLQV